MDCYKLFKEEHLSEIGNDAFKDSVCFLGVFPDFVIILYYIPVDISMSKCNKYILVYMYISYIYGYICFVI